MPFRSRLDGLPVAQRRLWPAKTFGRRSPARQRQKHFQWEPRELSCEAMPSPHDAPDQARENEARTRALIEAGYIVIRFHHAADWPAVFRHHPNLFGAWPHRSPSRSTIRSIIDTWTLDTT